MKSHSPGEVILNGALRGWLKHNDILWCQYPIGNNRNVNCSAIIPAISPCFPLFLSIGGYWKRNRNPLANQSKYWFPLSNPLNTCQRFSWSCHCLVKAKKGALQLREWGRISHNFLLQDIFIHIFHNFSLYLSNIPLIYAFEYWDSLNLVFPQKKSLREEFRWSLVEN